MCLLVVHFQVHDHLPLVVGANRDERYDRATSPMQLSGSSPRVLAGRDEEAGGTWLSVNDRGVVAGLTNQPLPGGAVPGKRSRGELPLLCTAFHGAAAAVDAFSGTVDTAQYNPCWLLVGDRERLFALEVRPGSAVEVNELCAGRHILENSPIGIPTAKSLAIAANDQAIPDGTDRPGLVTGLAELLADHEPAPPLPDGASDPRGDRRLELSSACVHTAGYGTRSSTIVLIDESEALPEVHFSNGAPCVSEFVEVSALWSNGEGPGRAEHGRATPFLRS